jgi:ATP-dependent Clp protease ATP-binding subunit ClpC
MGGASAGTASGEPPALSAMRLAPGGTTAEALALDGEYAAITEMLAAPEWEELKVTLSEPMRAPDFWSRPDRHRTLARLALMDRVKAAASTASSLRERLANSARHTGKSSRELVSRLAQQLHLIKEGMRDVREDAPIEVGLLVEPAFDKPGDNRLTRDWCAQLQGMYRAWAGKRNMQLAEIAGERPGDPPLLLISGFGAHRCLAQEVGLHVLDLGEDDKRGSRATARVCLTVAPLGDVPETRLRSLLLQALQQQSRPQAIVRRYRSDPSPLVRNMNGSGRTGRLDAVLQGDFDLIASA